VLSNTVSFFVSASPVGSEVLFTEQMHSICVLISFRRILMRSLSKIVVAGAVLALGSTFPVMAQIADGANMTFTTAFPFYAGNAKMAAGTYTITATDIVDDEMQIQSLDGKYARVCGLHTDPVRAAS
jgi:hypothetical protein